MAWTAPKIQALLLRLPRLQPSHETPTALNSPRVYGGSPSFTARENQSGIQKGGRY